MTALCKVYARFSNMGEMPLHNPSLLNGQHTIVEKFTSQTRKKCNFKDFHQVTNVSAMVSHPCP